MTDRLTQIRARLKLHHYPQDHAHDDVEWLLARVEAQPGGEEVNRMTDMLERARTNVDAEIARQMSPGPGHADPVYMSLDMDGVIKAVIRAIFEGQVIMDTIEVGPCYAVPKDDVDEAL